MTESGAMIEAVGLTKLYGSFAAIRDVSFSIKKGEVVAFLGPNGAGKSTTMKVLTGYLAPTSGAAKIAGMDVATHRLEAAARVGYLPENGPMYPEMTPRELLDFFGEARGLSVAQRRDRLAAVTDLCALSTVLDKPIRKLSKGFRQRVGMAHVLLHEPDVLIMDEPTSGLDPNQIRHVRDTLRTLGRTKTLLLATCHAVSRPRLDVRFGRSRKGFASKRLAVCFRRRSSRSAWLQKRWGSVMPPSSLRIFVERMG